MTDFEAFQKIPRLNREVVVTEKIDGTNAQIYIEQRSLIPTGHLDNPIHPFMSVTFDGVDYIMLAGSRSRWLGSGKADNFGFGGWVSDNRDELIKLGPGRHYGEWWGKGIQRGYGLDHKRFSLFNVHRWSDDATRPACCHVVPVIARGLLRDQVVEASLYALARQGSFAAPDFMNPEGVIVFHTASNYLFKATLWNDEKPKGKSQ